MTEVGDEIARMNARLRRPEAEVWVRLRRPSIMESIGRDLDEEAPPISPELLRLCEWIVDRAADAASSDGWDTDSGVPYSDQIRVAADQLVAMVIPTGGDPERLREAVTAWMEEWGWVDA